MDNDQQRRLLMAEFHDLVAVLQRRSLATDTPSDEEIRSMSNNDLSQWVRMLHDISRTPE